MTASARVHLAAVMLLAAASGCGRSVPSERGSEGVNAMTPQLAAELAAIRQARIYFYHHSVGVNILAGVERLDAKAGGEPLRLYDVEKITAVEGPAIVHGGGGRNGEPRTKIDFFAKTIRESPRLRPDLAFMKFCYVDFEPRTDVEELFSYYRQALDALRHEHPEIRFAHVTVPLMTRPTDLKSTVRRLLGKEVWDDAANAKRAEFNRRVRETFAADPVFDLAQVESTGPDGAPVTFSVNGHVYPSLFPGYTEDGGHLNEAGQRVAGTAAVRFMASALQGRSAGR